MRCTRKKAHSHFASANIFNWSILMRSRPTHFHDGRVKRYSTYFILDPLYSERNERFVENLNSRVKKLEIILATVH